MFASPWHAQATVARAEHEVPSAASYNIRVNVPVPPGTVTGTTNPFSFKMPNGTIVPSQIETVTSFGASPASSLEPDIVELIARITKDPSWSAGQKRTVDIVLQSSGAIPSHTSGPAALLTPTGLPSTVTTAVNDPNFLIVFAVDPLGTNYVAYPLATAGGFAATFKPIRQGSHEATQRSFTTMLPTTSLPGDRYPHLFGVHAYLSTFASENAIGLDVRITNGAEGTQTPALTDDPLGKVYFKEIMVGVRTNATTPWTVQDQFTRPTGPNGATASVRTIRGVSYDCYPLVKANAPVGGVTAMHPMGAYSQFHRRLVLSPTANAVGAKRLQDLRGQAFAIDGAGLWSFSNENTARYFPQRIETPGTYTAFGGTATIESTLTNELTALRTALQNNTAGTGNLKLAPAEMGWGRPMMSSAGTTHGADPGGQGIISLEGVRTLLSRSLNGLRLHRVVHELISERQRNVLWTSTGDPTYQDKWLSASGNPSDMFPATGPLANVPCRSDLSFYMDYGATSLPWTPINLFNPSPNWLPNQTVTSTPGMQPAYDGPDYWTGLAGSTLETNINGYEPHWASHLIRATANALALAWLTNDPLAKDDVMAQAELFRMTYSEYSNTTFNHSSSMWSVRNAIAAGCGATGFDIGRDDGWGMMTASAAYGFGDSAWRARNRIWFDRIVTTMQSGMAQNIVDQAFLNPATGSAYSYGTFYARFDGNFFSGAGAPAGQQSWEEMIVDVGADSMRNSVYAPSEANAANLLSMLNQSFLSMLAPTHWNETQGNIWDRIPIYDQTCSLFNCDQSFLCAVGSNPLPPGFGPYNPSGGGPSSGHYALFGTAGGYRASGDPIFLSRSLSILGQPSSCGSAAACEAALRGYLETSVNMSDWNAWWTVSNYMTMLGHLQ